MGWRPERSRRRSDQIAFLNVATRLHGWEPHISSHNSPIATSTSHLEAASAEPTVRTITHLVPNLRNHAVAEKYKRQREVIDDATARQIEEMSVWESVQSHEGWV
jgi:hypothetical protein